MATASEVVAANIRAEVARRAVVQVDLAAVLGLSQTGISKRLRGATPFSLNELHTIAAFLDVPVAALLPPEPANALTG